MSKTARVLTLGAQAPVHRIPSRLLDRAVRVLVVGCGGSGSEIVSGLPYLHQAMLAHGHPGGLDVLVMDGDVVTPTNIVRQPFGLGDIGHHKAPILVNRVNAFWGLRWKAIARHLSMSSPKLGADIVIGCVDSRTARSLIHRNIQSDLRVSYWLDLGNNAASGQFILGQPERLVVRKSVGGSPQIRTPVSVERLPTVAELYHETVEVALDKGDDRPSCSAVEALTRQEPFVNRAIAGQALAMLARLFRYGQLSYHGAFVNLESGRTVSMPVSPEHWARIMSRAPVAARKRRSAA